MKLPIYAAQSVRHVWLIDPIAKTLEVHVLGDNQKWREVRVFEGDLRVRAEPFAAISHPREAILHISSIGRVEGLSCKYSGKGSPPASNTWTSPVAGTIARSVR